MTVVYSDTIYLPSVDPSDLTADGIGDLGPQAYRWIDWLAAAGCTLWQVLPLGPTGYGDSPYQCFSAFAGNPLNYRDDIDIVVFRENTEGMYIGVEFPNVPGHRLRGPDTIAQLIQHFGRSNHTLERGAQVGSVTRAEEQAVDAIHPDTHQGIAETNCPLRTVCYLPQASKGDKGVGYVFN